MKVNQKSIFEFNTQDKMLKFKTNAFPIGRVLASFVQYNTDAEKGNKVLASADFYLTIADAKLLANDILSGKIAKLCKAEQAKGSKYPKAVWKLQGGVTAEECKTRQIRDDGKCLARVMSLVPGSKFPYCFKIEQGPGDRAQKDGKDTLIVPCWKKPEVSMYIPCSAEDLKKLALMLNSYIDAYVALDLKDF